jgi:hypothetical protein
MAEATYAKEEKHKPVTLEIQPMTLGCGVQYVPKPKEAKDGKMGK